MNSLASIILRRFSFAKIVQYFLQGLLVIAPVAITLYAVYWIVSSIDSLLPIFTTRDESGRVKVQNYGLGFVIIIIAIFLIGYFGSFFLRLKMFSLVDYALERTPGIRFIYVTVRDFFEAFAGNKRKFDKPVLVNVDAPDVWRVGFITGQSLTAFELEEHVAVYVPHSYAISGITYFVTPSRIKILHHVSAVDAMKFTVSGGVSQVHE